MFSRSPWDWALIAAYFAFLVVVWWRGLGRRLAVEDYLVAGRRVTLPAFVATLVATWYGGVLGVGEYSYRYGLSNWLVFGVPYYLGALLFAWLFAARARTAALYTLPDLLHERYGRGPALMGALTVFVSSAPAAYVLMLGTLFAAMAPLPLWLCVIGAALFSIFYIHGGGLRTVVFTDQVQFVLMYLGFGIMLAFLVAQHGGLSFLRAALPAAHFTWHGGNPPQAIVVWYFIALGTLVDPGFWQRAYAARDARVARRGVLISILFWALFDFLTTTTGLYARALLPGLDKPVFAFPDLAMRTLPPVALGLFYLGMIATVMSTIDSYGFIAATTLARDVLHRLRPQGGDSLTRRSQAALWIAMAFASVLALAHPSVIDLWHDLGSITAPTLLLPVATALIARGRLGPRWTLTAMVAAFAVSLAWVLAHRSTGRHPWSVEPIYAGLATSLLIYLAGWISSGRRTPRVAPAAGAALAVALAACMTSAAAAQIDSATVAPDTLARVVALPEVVVSTTRADERAPIARTTLGREELARVNWGQDTPMALAKLPGAYAYSDAGNGIGYSYLSLRGFAQRRISVLVNGVPLNDPQSHEVYWIDHPDLLASTAEAQVQRGVGSALYGAASVGGSVNLETSPFTESPTVTALAGFGSYDTRRLMVEAGSGRLQGDWQLYGRYSRIETDGYRDQSGSELWSYTLSARKSFGRNVLRANLYGGPEETHLAYLGVSREFLDGAISGDADRDRRFNPLTYPGERDHFFEPHYELMHSWSPHAGLALSQTLYYFDGAGYYDEQRFGASLTDYRLTPWQTSDGTLFPPEAYRDTTGDGVPDPDASGMYTVERADIVRRRSVSNRQVGWVPRVRMAHAGGALTIGAEMRAADGRHVGEVLSGSGLPPGTPPDVRYYDYRPRTIAGGLFVREEWDARPTLRVTADLAWRYQSYHMRDDRFDGIAFDQTYNFALPRLGVTWTPRRDLSAFVAWSSASREPAFRDLYDAESPGSVPLYEHVDVPNNVYLNPLVRPERVRDLELGGTWSPGWGFVQANLFRMDFGDELVYAGQFNTDLGYATVGNAARSLHQGVEIAARAERRGPVSLAIDGNLTASDNHFIDYTEYDQPGDGSVVAYDFDGNTIGSFPALIGNLGLRAGWKGATLGLEAQGVGRIFLDNSEDETASLAPRTVLNLIAGWRLPYAGSSQTELTLRVFNLADARYEAGGYTYRYLGERYVEYIPAATRNAMAEVRVRF